MFPSYRDKISPRSIGFGERDRRNFLLVRSLFAESAHVNQWTAELDRFRSRYERGIDVASHSATHGASFLGSLEAARDHADRFGTGRKKFPGHAGLPLQCGPLQLA